MMWVATWPDYGERKPCNPGSLVLYIVSYSNRATFVTIYLLPLPLYPLPSPSLSLSLSGFSLSRRLDIYHGSKEGGREEAVLESVTLQRARGNGRRRRRWRSGFL